MLHTIQYKTTAEQKNSINGDEEKSGYMTSTCREIAEVLAPDLSVESSV